MEELKKDKNIQKSGTPCTLVTGTGGGGSKTPTANHRRPLPFRKRLCGRTLWPEVCQAIGPCVPRVGLENVRGRRWRRMKGSRGRKKGGDGPLGVHSGPQGLSWARFRGWVYGCWRMCSPSLSGQASGNTWVRMSSMSTPIWFPSPIMVFSWTCSGLAQRKGRIVSGPAGPSRAILGSSGSCVYMLLETSSGTHCSSFTAGSFDVEDAIGVGSPKSLMRVSGNARWIL